MDTRLPRGVPLPLLHEALVQGRGGRAEVLADMRACAPARPEAARPRFGQVGINKDLVGRLVGEQGSNIRALQAESHARLHVTEGGEVTIYAPDGASFARAAELVKDVQGATVDVGQASVGGGAERSWLSTCFMRNILYV